MSVLSRAKASTFSFRWPVMYTICSMFGSFFTSSSTYCITGFPATRSIGFGVWYVCGRSRVPFPASGMITFTLLPRIGVGVGPRACPPVPPAASEARRTARRHRSLPLRRARPLSAVAILQTYHIIQMRSRCFQHVAVSNSFHLVYRSRLIPERFTSLERDLLQLAVAYRTNTVDHLAAEQIDRLVLLLVILHR